MASTVTEQCACSPEGGEDLSVDMGCSSAQLTSQSEPPLAEEKRSEERETIVSHLFYFSVCTLFFLCHFTELVIQIIEF